jgi:hypothetical protein
VRKAVRTHEAARKLQLEHQEGRANPPLQEAESRVIKAFVEFLEMCESGKITLKGPVALNPLPLDPPMDRKKGTGGVGQQSSCGPRMNVTVGARLGSGSGVSASSPILYDACGPRICLPYQRCDSFSQDRAWQLTTCCVCRCRNCMATQYGDHRARPERFAVSRSPRYACQMLGAGRSSWRGRLSLSLVHSAGWGGGGAARL